MKPLSEHQRDALRRAKDGKVRVSGRGCKVTLDGLALRDMVREPRIDFSLGSYGTGYVATLTPWGERCAFEIRTSS